MKKDEFVIELKKYNLSRGDLEKLHISEELIDKEIRNHVCVLRKQPLINLFVNSEVVSLLNYYDCTNVVIGVLTFSGEIDETDDYYLIGQVEADLLAINKITLEVQVLDYLDLNHVIFNCAVNGESFLDAILICAEYFSHVLKSDDLTVDKLFTFNYVQQSAEKAGGDKYIEFYKLLLVYW
ncbi:hypothetical protein HB364_16225 [Pseudoflavitalea sp. X16]|uniref:hypothetical protein n=1 Tax=Paraflavitalea devenefica TaxID=2716334 RepID=UPI001424236F|nr:hypothetical protein [Paraflavitalea devenefica]NII26637.1 hypothetical protein [Paraflavitalea devenefica]